MTTTDLKPGDLVQHPEKGRGLVHRRFARNDVGVVYADKDRDGITSYTYDLTGWERVETVRPGHVQVRVDDLDQYPSYWLNEDEYTHGFSGRVAIRAAKALAAQRTENTPPADEQEADFAIGWLNCPWCSESFTIAPRLARDAGGHVRNVGLSIVHTCPPVQPDEPTEFGARVTVTLPDGTREKWLRQVDGWWVNEQGGSAMWKHLIKRGTATLGWDE